MAAGNVPAGQKNTKAAMPAAQAGASGATLPGEKPPAISGGNRSMLIFLYLTLIAGIFFQYSISAALISSAVILLAVMIAYFMRGLSKNALTRNHADWIVKTFWYGTAVILPILTLIAGAVVYFLLMPVIQHALEYGLATPATMKQYLLNTKADELLIIAMVTLLPFAAWWIYRCGKGINHLLRDKNIVSKISWL